MVVICKNPNVRMSIMVTKDIWPAVVSLMECHDLSYKTDKQLKDDEHVRINDISGRGDNLMKLFNELDRFINDENGKPRKIYILLSAKREKKKEGYGNVQKDRSEINEGSEGRDSGESGNSGSGQDSDDSGAGDRPAVVNDDDLRALEVLQEAPAADNDCD